MKKSTKLYIVPKLFLLIIVGKYLTFSAFSQSTEQTFAFAKEQMNAGNYQQAALLYERMLFFDSAFVYTAQIYPELAACYEHSNDLVNAAKQLGFAYRFADSDGKIEILLKKAELFLLSGETEFAYIELLDLPEKISTSDEFRRNTMLGIIHFRKQNYTDAEKYFSLCNTDKKQQFEINECIKKAGNANKRFPKWVRYISLAVPGSAQLIYGDYKGGINSLALVGGFTLLYMHTIKSYSLIDAWLSVFPWYIRYYQGGFENTAEIREIKKQAYLDKQLRIILETISKN